MNKIRTITASLAFVIMAGLTAVPALAEPVRMLMDKSWSAFRFDDTNGRICFISSDPTSSKGKYNPENRGAIHVFVSHGPGKAERNVVQIIAGYRYKSQSDVTMTIDGNKFKLFTIEDRAYAESEEDDTRIIAAMKRGSKMTVVGTSSRDTVTTDTYSLLGFSKTKSVIDKTCK